VRIVYNVGKAIYLFISAFIYLFIYSKMTKDQWTLTCQQWYKYNIQRDNHICAQKRK